MNDTTTTSNVFETPLGTYAVTVTPRGKSGAVNQLIVAKRTTDNPDGDKVVVDVPISSRVVIDEHFIAFLMYFHRVVITKSFFELADWSSGMEYGGLSESSRLFIKYSTDDDKMGTIGSILGIKPISEFGVKFPYLTKVG
jgi:hypothetical protein